MIFFSSYVNKTHITNIFLIWSFKLNKNMKIHHACHRGIYCSYCIKVSFETPLLLLNIHRHCVCTDISPSKPSPHTQTPENIHLLHSASVSVCVLGKCPEGAWGLWSFLLAKIIHSISPSASLIASLFHFFSFICLCLALETHPQLFLHLQIT